jgi:hypothetical protein
LTLAERPTLPVFLALSMSKEATPWTILSWGSTLLHGMSRSLCPGSVDLRAPLLGFLAPTALWEKGVHVPPVTRQAPGHPGFAPAVPIPPATVPLSGFPNLAAVFFLPSPSCRFQAGGAPGVLPFRGLFHPRSPGSSSPPACPPDVSPQRLAFPILGGEPWGAPAGNLGTPASAICRLQGLRPRESQHSPPGHG